MVETIMRRFILSVMITGRRDVRLRRRQRPPIALPSWRDGPAKQAIVRFVEEVTQKGGTAFIPPAERIAVFDNDGTLWVEQPMYVQLAFALDRIKALAPAHPEWKDKQPFKAAIEGDLRTVAAGGEHALLELLMATHAGMTTDEFAQTVEDWLSNGETPALQPALH